MRDGRALEVAGGGPAAVDAGAVVGVSAVAVGVTRVRRQYVSRCNLEGKEYVVSVEGSLGEPNKSPLVVDEWNSATGITEQGGRDGRNCFLTQQSQTRQRVKYKANRTEIKTEGGKRKGNTHTTPDDPGCTTNPPFLLFSPSAAICSNNPSTS